MATCGLHLPARRSRPPISLRRRRRRPLEQRPAGLPVAVVPDAAGDIPVRILAREFLRVGAGIQMRRAVGVTFKRNGGDGDDRACGQALFQVVIFGLAFSEIEPPSIIVDHDVDMIRIIEGRGAAIKHGVIKRPLGRSELPDQLRKLAPTVFRSRPGRSFAPAKAQNQNMEVIHHPNYDKNVFMPFVPAIKIKSGKILWLAGTTALPVYHDHPHKRDQIQQYMVNDLETQTRAAMDGIKQTLDASGASFKDVVHYFVFRARPRMGDIGKASAVINSYFAPFNHKPTSTNVAVLELGEPEQLIEIQMFAVVD